MKAIVARNFAQNIEEDNMLDDYNKVHFQ